ncbi:MAG TPA: BsuBI/PstI family type II restriction endonuclease [Hanamia sp.]|nr:BsuBI/PstI family type II restriction endonuclease [Hanamia sp.]
MSKIDDAKEILKELGMPAAQQKEIAAYTLLALSTIKPNSKWSKATRESKKVSKDIMGFCKDVYKKDYAPNTRENFRRQVLHQFVQARIADYNPDNPLLPVNSPNAHYALTSEALEAIKTYGTKAWKKAAESFKSEVGELSKRYLKERKQNLIPVKLSNGKTIKLSAGKHNLVQAAIVQDFAARFANESEVLYLGDTARKDLYVDKKTLKEIGIPITQHSKLPDVVLFDKKRNWLFLIEAVTSHGPVSPKRIIELEELLKNCKAGKVYVTAFPDFAEFKKHSTKIAWETEVWVVDFPEHMIHFNGDRFIGPR